MNYATRTITAAAALALFALGMAPEFVDSLSFGDALRVMRYVGGSSNAGPALLTFALFTIAFAVVLTF